MGTEEADRFLDKRSFFCFRRSRRVLAEHLMKVYRAIYTEEKETRSHPVGFYRLHWKFHVVCACAHGEVKFQFGSTTQATAPLILDWNLLLDVNAT